MLKRNSGIFLSHYCTLKMFWGADHELITSVLNSTLHQITLFNTVNYRRKRSIARWQFITIALVINELINTIKREKLISIGYIYDGCIPLNLCLEFEDDTATVTTIESGKQHLVNAFAKWLSRTGLIITVDKCSIFGIEKVRTDSAQYGRYLKLANEPIQWIKMNKSFTYLGKDFNMHMSNDHITSQLVSTFKQ